jgi:hypothetical protein
MFKLKTVGFVFCCLLSMAVATQTLTGKVMNGKIPLAPILTPHRCGVLPVAGKFILG